MFDRFARIVFMALGVALFFYAQTLTTSSTGGSIGPKELPLFLAVVLILFSLVNLVTALRAKAAPKQDGPAYRQFLVILGLLPWLLRIAAAVLLIRGLLDHPFRWENLIPAAVAFGLSVLLH